MWLALPYDHVFDNIVLSVENNVSEFSEVLNNVLVLKVTLNDDGAALVVLEVGIFYELLDEWIKDPVELLALG